MSTDTGLSALREAVAASASASAALSSGTSSRSFLAVNIENALHRCHTTKQPSCCGLRSRGAQPGVARAVQEEVERHLSVEPHQMSVLG